MDFRRKQAIRQWGAAALILGFLLLVLPTVPVELTAQGVARWDAQAPFRKAEQALYQPAEALRLYAQADQTVADTQFGILAAQVVQAKSDPARLDTLAQSPTLDLRPSGPYHDRWETYLLRGQIARQQGNLEQAGPMFNDPGVIAAGLAAQAWAWDHFAIRDSRPITIDVGTGFDLGYFQGMAGPERDAGGMTYRWTGGETALWNPNLSMADPSMLVLRLNGWRPPGWPAAQLELDTHHCGADGCIDKTEVVTLPTEDRWQEVTFAVSPPSLSNVRLRVNTFVPGGSDPRDLGVKVDWIQWK